MVELTADPSVSKELNLLISSLLLETIQTQPSKLSRGLRLRIGKALRDYAPVLGLFAVERGGLL